MKRSYYFASLYLLLFPVLLWSQQNSRSWEEMLYDHNISFFEIQKAFYAQCGEQMEENCPGYKKFKRWEYFMESRVNKNGFYNPAVARSEWQRYKQNYVPAQTEFASTCPTSPSGNWTHAGPTVVPASNNGIGRINVVAFHPTDTNTIWAGSPGGGLWKSTDAGQTWSTNTDTFMSLGVSEIAIAEANPDIMYLGTGDRDGSDTYCYGFLKSTDGGNTWSLVGNISPTEIHRIIVYPNSADTLIAATSSGIYKSTDGGVLWTLKQSGHFRHMEVNPLNPDVVHATTYTTPSQYYKSTSFGETFSSVSVPAAAGGCTPRRMAIGVSKADTSYVYLFAGYDDPANVNDFCALYRSTE